MSQVPGPELQIEFLQKLQRIYEEGDFTATYKFALLIALAELAVERGDDTGAPLTLRIEWIAEKFAELYWPQSAPYSAGIRGTSPDVLAQNLGAQAAVVNALITYRRTAEGALSRARGSIAWNALVRRIATVVRSQPVNFLQNVGGETVQFLYQVGPERGALTLLPGVAFCLRRFQGLVQQLSRVGWIRHIRENVRNRAIVGEAGDLEAFMFDTRRPSLEPVREVLLEFQSGACFYCNRSIRDQSAVDHFIPWSKYPRDLAHNFVLAHASCNGSKSDALPAKEHIVRWRTRNDSPLGSELGNTLAIRGFVADVVCSRTVAKWAYGQGLAIGAHAWQRGTQFERIDAHYLSVLQ